MILRAVFGEATTIALATVVLHLSLVIFERYTVLEVLFTGYASVVASVGLGAPLSIITRCLAAHLLLLSLCLLLLALQLLLLLHKICAGVLV